jgi:PAS domain S-box-containing protein
MSKDSEISRNEDSPELWRICGYLLDSSPQPMVAVTGTEHAIAYVNNVFSRLVAKNAQELIGHPLGEVIPIENGIGLFSLLDRVYRTGTPEVADEQQREPQVYWSYKAWPIGGAQQPLVGVMVQITDSTENARSRNMAGAMNEAMMLSSIRQNELTEKLRLSMADLARSNEQFYTLANAMPQLVWIAHSDGNVFWYNQRWYEYTGTTREQMEGCGWQSVHDPEVLPSVMERLKRSITLGEPFDMEFPLRGADGVFRMFLTRSLPLKNSEGDVVQWFGTCTDITELKHLEETLMQRGNELAEANKELESFSYSISHDLRGPLQTIMGFTNMLQEVFSAAPNAEGQDFLKHIIRSADKMAGLINDILELSKISRTSINIQEIDLSDIALSVINELRQTEPERKINVVIAKELKVQGDARLMNIALSNLIGNAWKYSRKTPDAYIEFGVMEKSGEKIYYVKDNGAGFDMKYAEKLFVPFQRLHSDKQFPGTGIGLAIVNRVIQKHDGLIWGESEPEKGATFYFTLPK